MRTKFRINSGNEVFVRKRVKSLKPSPENLDIYHPIDPDGPEIVKLAKSIKTLGCDPLTVTLDLFIVAGHRRQLALIRNGQKYVRCRVLPVRRDALSVDEYKVMLRNYNLQRPKSVAEQVREEMIDMDPGDAHRVLRDMRDKSVYAAECNGVQTLEIEGVKKRYNISDDKAEHVKYVKKVVFEDRKKYWPLTIRAVHYALLNYDFVRGYYWPKRHEPGHGTAQERRYQNDDDSYGSSSDLITRLRLAGVIPWKAFDDPTRPLKEFFPFANAREYVRQEVEDLFTGYWRDLQQSQPNHIEVICEKNTIYPMVLRVTEKYQITTSSGRGFNSIDPWHDLHYRYLASGKQRLIVIVLSDYDPEGEVIPHVGGRTLRDDLQVPQENLTIIKAGVTREQIAKYGLRPMNFAKEASSNWDWFVQRNGGDNTVYELEALNPEDMLMDLDTVIKNVIDIDLFNREVKIEQDQDAPFIVKAKEKVTELLKGLSDE